MNQPTPPNPPTQPNLGPSETDGGPNDGWANNEISLGQAQTLVDDWIKTVGVRYFSELTNLAQLVEEVGEVSRIMSRTYGEQSFKSNEQDANLGDELADVMFVLICIANQTGVDLTSAFRKNLEKKTVRDATRHLNNEKLACDTPNHDDQTSAGS